MKRVYAAMLSFGVAAGGFAQANPTAVIHTTDGDITIELHKAKAPKTVDNFIGLATGKKVWLDPATRQPVKDRPLYNGVIFHRTIPGFMIQGGDPLGSGMGGPGFQFENEDSDLRFDKEGVVAMANAGRDTNGSQFFITVAPRHHLDGGYTIFGQVTDGMDVVHKIVNKPTGANDRPNDPTVIRSIEIKDPSAAAKDSATTGTATADPATTAPATDSTTGTASQN